MYVFVSLVKGTIVTHAAMLGEKTLVICRDNALEFYDAATMKLVAERKIFVGCHIMVPSGSV